MSTHTFFVAVVGVNKEQAWRFIESLEQKHLHVFCVDDESSLFRQDISAIFLLHGWEYRADADDISAMVQEKRKAGSAIYKIARI